MADEVVSTGLINTESAPAEEVVPVEAELEAAPTEEQAPKPEEVAPQTEEDKRFAAKFAALTRKEKAIRESEKKLNARMKELEAKLAAQTPPPAPTEVEEPLERRLRKDPFKTLESLGVDYATLTQIALNNGKLTPELQMQLMKEEIESKYSSQLEEVNKKLTAREEREAQEKEAAIINNFKGAIASEVKAQAETYELVAAEGEDGIEVVFDIIDGYYKETGEVLDIKDALEAAEEELLEQAKKRIGLAKIKKLMGAPETKTQETKPQAPAQAAPKKTGATLSNTASQVQPTSGRYLSDDESKAEAAKLIRFDA